MEWIERIAETSNPWNAIKDVSVYEKRILLRHHC